MTLSHIKELESLGFEWGIYSTAWEDRLSELAEYRKIHGHCNVTTSYIESSKLALWVANQRKQYKLHLEGNRSQMTPFRVQTLEDIGFEWGSYAAWGDRSSELTEYRKIHGHCNVPTSYSENTKVAKWVAYQRSQFKLQQEGKKSQMTPSRIQALEDIAFEWNSHSAAWKARLSELADYQRSNGHYNVPQSYSENAKLASWVAYQRREYRLLQEGKASLVITFRIQESESLGFEWKSFISRGKVIRSSVVQLDEIKGGQQSIVPAVFRVQSRQCRSYSIEQFSCSEMLPQIPNWD
jgi:hypothetical protein